ncbi:MAG: response regulator [Pseudomonadales bacterium]|nr:response regulator [Pseudomonadales bacterium]
MLLTDHLRKLWNGGLNPAKANPTSLRERRTLSTTIFAVIPVVILLFISNYYTGGERDNLYIALASGMLLVSLYIQAYTSQQLIASQLPIMSFWAVICIAMMTVGVSGNTWAWLLCMPAIASLVAGRAAGIIWALACALTLWFFAYLEFTGFTFEFALATTNAQPFAMAFEATMVLIMLTAATFVFVSGQLNAERKLNSTVNQLEREVHERALAENEARQSEQAKSSFLAAMSHELRTPLNGVIGASQLLKVGELPSKKRELVDVVLYSSQTLLELINNVLDLSRLDSHEIELESIPVDLRELIGSAMAPLSFQAREKGVKFSAVVEDDIPEWIVGDPTRLRQVMINLVGNAVKFTNTGEITVVVDTALERIRLKIEDTGIGISKDAQSSLFEPYVQADIATMRKFGGSGLGLTIVKKLITAMGGKIVVDSVPGRGSTFTVFMPLKRTRAPVKKLTEVKETRLPKMSVLVADDNAVNRMVLSRMLEQDGHRVVSMSNGKEVLEYLPDHDVNMVFMDLQMPVMDGVAAMRKIRNMRGRKAETPIIAVTANVVSETPEDVIKQGMDAFLAKPYLHTELREAMHNAAAKSPVAPVAHSKRMGAER